MTDPFTTRIAELSDDSTTLPHFVHEDGSHTFVVQDDLPSPDLSPREDDGNVVRLVNTNSNYVDLDDSDPGLDAARNRFDGYGIARTSHPTWGIGAISRHDRAYMVQRYVSIFRPDIVLYVDEWQVTGYMQGEWQGGYAYVRHQDIADLPAVVYNTDADLALSRQAQYHVDAELKVYEQWFRGEVYGVVHVERGEEVWAIGDEGGYFTGEHEVEEESVWGFIGDDFDFMVGDLTASPVIERI